MKELKEKDIYNRAKVDSLIRAKLITASRGRIYQIAAHLAGRPLSWENDDELSVALLAFNEAIDTYDPERGKNFWNYANLVIKNRMLDYFRKETAWKNRIVYEEGDQGISYEIAQQEKERAFYEIRQKEAAEDTREKIIFFQELLKEFKISFKDLVKSSPKHRDTRENLLKIAETIVANELLLKKLFETKKLPIKELTILTGQSRKVLETSRRYLIALVLILSKPELNSIKEFLQFPKEVKR